MSDDDSVCMFAARTSHRMDETYMHLDLKMCVWTLLFRMLVAERRKLDRWWRQQMIG